MDSAISIFSGTRAPALNSPPDDKRYRFGGPQRLRIEGETGLPLVSYPRSRMNRGAAFHSPETASVNELKSEVPQSYFRRAHVGRFNERRERDFDSFVLGSLAHATQLTRAPLNHSIGNLLDSPQTFPELIEPYEPYIVIGEGQRNWTFLGDRLAVEIVAARAEVIGPIGSLAEQAEPKIIELLELDLGWDGYGGIPILPNVAACARRLLDTFGNHTRIVPDIVPLSNGGLQLEWFVGGDELEVRIDSDCVASVFYESDRDDNARQFDLDDPLNEERIAPILQGLSR